MSQPGVPNKSQPSKARATADALPVWIIALVLVVVPAALAASATWYYMDGPVTPAQAGAPAWLVTDTLRATAGSGEVIKARVALDAPDPQTRDLINSRAAQVALVMQIGVAECDLGQDTGALRVQKLSAGLRDHLNEFLVSSKVPPVRDLVIQDLVVGRP